MLPAEGFAAEPEGGMIHWRKKKKKKKTGLLSKNSCSC